VGTVKVERRGGKRNQQCSLFIRERKARGTGYRAERQRRLLTGPQQQPLSKRALAKLKSVNMSAVDLHARTALTRVAIDVASQVQATATAMSNPVNAKSAKTSTQRRRQPTL